MQQRVINGADGMRVGRWERVRRWLRVLLPTVFTFALAWFVADEWPVIAAAANANVIGVVTVAVLVAVSHFLNATQFVLLYAVIGVRVSVFENWMLFAAGQLGNHLPARAGTLYRLHYMNAVRNATYVQSTVIYASNSILTIGVTALVGLAGILGMTQHTAFAVLLPLGLIFIGLGVLAAVAAWCPFPRFPDRDGALARFWRKFHDGYGELRRAPSQAISVAALECIKNIVTAWRMQIAFSMVGIEQPVWFFLVLAPTAGFAGLIGLAPAAIGLRELFVTAAATALGLDVSGGLLGATIDRAAMLLTSVILGTAGFIATYPRLRAVER